MSLDLLSMRDYLNVVGEPRPWTLPISHWSPSSFAMLQRCPRQWQERYIHGRKERPAEAPVIGQAVHHAVETNFSQKIDSHEDMNPAVLMDWYMDSVFPTTVLDEQNKAGEEVHWDTDIESARTRGRHMLAEYHGLVAPRIQPLAVETFVSVDLGLPVPVEGRFDVEREESVIDIKTGKQASRTPKMAWKIQAVVYGEARDKPVEFHSVTAKTNKVTIVTPLESEGLFVQPSKHERDVQRRLLISLSEMACFYMSVYGPDEPWPTLGQFHDWACSYCGFRKDCPAWSTT